MSTWFLSEICTFSLSLFIYRSMVFHFSPISFFTCNLYKKELFLLLLFIFAFYMSVYGKRQTIGAT